MSISELEVKVILAEQSKRIDGDVIWRDRQGRAAGKVFRVDVGSEPDWALFIAGFWNPESGKLTYDLVHGKRDRIIGLHLGVATRTRRETASVTRTSTSGPTCTRKTTHMSRRTLRRTGMSW